MTAGRPKGSYQYGEAKVHRTHFMTPGAHGWILANKPWIEETAQWAPPTEFGPEAHKCSLTCLKGEFMQSDIDAIEALLGPLCHDDLIAALRNAAIDGQETLRELEERAEDAEGQVEELEAQLAEAKSRVDE